MEKHYALKRVRTKASKKNPHGVVKPKLQQLDKFREAARELGTDDREERFDELLRKVTKAPPPQEKKPVSE
jgi:hypothetical protein